MKKISLFILCLILLMACSEESSESEETEITRQKETTEESDINEEEENEEVNDVSADNQIDDENTYPPIPTTFMESVEYPIIGEFSGTELPENLEEHDELMNLMEQFPIITEDTPEEEINQFTLYLFSLFREELTAPDIALDQWEAMGITPPDEVDEGDGEAAVTVKQNYNMAILLDASGSMANLEGDQTRMQLAKDAIENFVQDLPEAANVSLYVYGHKGSSSESDRPASCEGIEEVYPLGNFDRNNFNKALDQFNPAGWTPMASAIEYVENDWKELQGEENINTIYLVSDGIETCDGDPVAAIQSLKESNVAPLINIIGYQVDNEGAEQLREMAEAAEAKFIDAKSQEDLVAEFELTIDNAKIWSEWAKDERKNVGDLKIYVREQIGQWSVEQKDIKSREFHNLEKVLEYMQDKEKIEFLKFVDIKSEYQDNWIRISSEVTNDAIDFFQKNRESFGEKLNEINEEYDQFKEEAGKIQVGKILIYFSLWFFLNDVN
ncbi:VWA domain-containing protein [Gracilibacillus oryzae]|uniref:VWA domain-containing protein n=1 Tax=Gracilibacillus oryzae TaxID=1672701 RepID=A0A7C8GX27_9BACI|nr:VWA domain-containing protein [Gracilibacillus oryzae]KAB8139468.1 VWA domain-containing protein [Gracilibacillus oryzae]